MGTRERRQREKEARRQQILAAAHAEFLEKTPAAATMPGVARRAQLSIGALYLYFASKDDLYTAFLIDGLDRLRAAMSAAVPAEAAPIDAASAVLLTMLDFFAEHPEYRDSLTLDLSDRLGARTRGVSAQSAELLEAKRGECRRVLAAVLERGVESGEFIKGDLERMAEVVWSLVAGVVLSTNPAQGSALAQRAAVTIILRGISAA